MTKRDFFRIIIKLFGLYSLILSLFSFLPQNISNVFIYKGDIWMLLAITFSFFLILALFLILLFKTDLIIDKLKLDKGFDDENIILGNFNNEQIFKLALILIGGILIVDYFPRFICEALNVFKKEVSNNEFYGFQVDYYSIFISIFNVILGLITIANYKKISIFLDKK